MLKLFSTHSLNRTVANLIDLQKSYDPAENLHVPRRIHFILSVLKPLLRQAKRIESVRYEEFMNTKEFIINYAKLLNDTVIKLTNKAIMENSFHDSYKDLLLAVKVPVFEFGLCTETGVTNVNVNFKYTSLRELAFGPEKTQEEILREQCNWFVNSLSLAQKSVLSKIIKTDYELKIAKTHFYKVM